MRPSLFRPCPIGMIRRNQKIVPGPSKRNEWRFQPCEPAHGGGSSRTLTRLSPLPYALTACLRRALRGPVERSHVSSAWPGHWRERSSEVWEIKHNDVPQSSAVRRTGNVPLTHEALLCFHMRLCEVRGRNGLRLSGFPNVGWPVPTFHLFIK